MKNTITLFIVLCIGSFGFGQDIDMQDGTFTQCSGIFYDSGGSGDRYDNNEDFTITICPDDNTENLQLDFSFFNTQVNFDIMTIYDGDDDAAISLGSFSGSTSPGIVTASDANPTGCLTINFVSNGNGNGQGWTAEISCVAACQAITASIDSTDPVLQGGNIVEADINEVITFNGSGTFSVDGTGATYTWDFGDGNTATGQSVTHSYATAGLYNVTLSITDPANCTNLNSDVSVTAQIGSTNPGNPFVEAGDDVDLPCTETCTTLSASFLDIGDTSTYNVTSIPFVPPFSFNGLTNSLNPNADDQWSGVEDLPFNFCFFDEIRTQFQVGSNGVIRFDVNAGDTSNGYALGNGDTLPNDTNPTLSEANVLTPSHDIDPTVSNNEEISWEIIGTAPNRVLAVTFFEVPLYSSGCNNLLATHMAVFYETTNVVDIYIQDKPTCTSWNDGNAVVGIQNDEGTIAFVPPGRNTGQWTTTNEAWRFTPAGPSIIEFAWLDNTGTIVSTDPNFEVCPTAPSTTYTARVTYQSCDPSEPPVVVTDDVTVTTNSPFTVDLGPDQVICDSTATITTLDADVGIATATYQWALNGTDLAGETNATLVVNSPNSGTYSVVITNTADSCVSTDEVEVTFVPSPTANPVPDQFICDDNNDGFWDFDFSVLDATVIGAQSNVEVSYHGSSADAISGANPLPIPYTNATAYTAETIYVRIQVAGDTSCFDTSQFDINVFNSPTASPVDDQLICDDNNDGFWDFDLGSLRPTILGAQAPADYTVTFHPTAQDADDNTNALPDTYTNTTAYTAETIYVRVEDNTNPVCYAVTDFIINVFETPSANPVDNQFICDDNNDGFWAFDFTTLDATVIGAQTGMTVSYHSSQADADTGDNPLPNPYTNQVTYGVETVYIRIENSGNDQCFDASQNFEIDVFNSAAATSVDPQLICDDDNDGLWAFDLDALIPTILGAQSPADFTVTFHSSQADADNNVNVLVSPYTNTSAYDAETIYVRVENNANTNCDNTDTNFIIDVFNSPTSNPVMDQSVCDDDNDGLFGFDLDALIPTVLGAQSATEFTVTFHNSQADADNGDNALSSPYENQTAFTAETIYVRVENTDNDQCTDASTNFDINVFATPTADAIDPQLICDDNNDGLWIFDLDDLRATILGTQAPADYTVSFHQSQADADADAGALPDNYQNMTPYVEETIYVRVENNANTDCINTDTNFIIDVFNSPTSNPVMDQSVCDDDNDGFFGFDLDALIPTVLGAQSATEFTVTFHNSQVDADNGDNALASPYENQTAFTAETIYVRVENVDNDQCAETSTNFDINVFATPTAETIDPQLICDDNNDGLWIFDLDALRATILGTQAPADYTVSFHQSQADADTGAGALPDNYQNMMPYVEETIFVRVENNANSDCINTNTNFIIDVFNDATANPVDDQPVCDEDGNGFEVFDLGALRADALGAQSPTEYTVTFHTSQGDANTGANPLADSYTNSQAFVYETIFVRVLSNGSPCFDTTSFELQVNPLPDDTVDISDFFECEVNFDGVAEFDLESKNDEILNGQDPALFTVTYHDSQVDADNLANALVSPYENTSNPQTIYVAITNNNTGCSVSTQTFSIEVQESADAQDDFYELCDTVGDNDGSTQFDLESRIPIVLNGQDPTAYSIDFFFSEANALNNEDPLPLLYENVVNPQIIYARVSNNIRPEECFDISEVTLQTNLLPIFDLDDEYTLCLTSNDEAVVDIPPVIDTELPAADYSFEWSFNGTVLPTETGPSLIPTQGGTYTVIVTDTSTSTVTMCTETDTTEVIESGIPDTFDVEVTSQSFTGNNMIVATATGNSTYEFSLDLGPWELSSEFDNVSGGDHTVYVRDMRGCGILSRDVTIIDYPKFFTPNGDGNNETWNITSIDTQPTAVIYIHDRFGKLLKQLSPTSPGWDGTYNGNLMPSSDYWFTLEYVEPTTGEAKSFRAHFALKR